MVSYKLLQERIITVQETISAYEVNLFNDPDNFGLQIQTDNLRSHLADLQNQLYNENLKRDREIIKLRFMGEITKRGSLPLYTAGKLSEYFSKGLFESAKYFQYGNKTGRKIDENIIKEIDLRLEGVSSGSAVLIISAKISPDLSGNSVIQNSLNNTFGFFSREEPQEVIEEVSNLGSRSVKYFNQFLSELEKNDLEVDYSWIMPEAVEKRWEGTKAKISVLRSTLNTLEISEKEESDFSGEIIMLSSKGKFEIMTDDKLILAGKFPNELLQKIKSFHIGERCNGKYWRTSIINRNTNKENSEFTLVDINKI